MSLLNLNTQLNTSIIDNHNQINYIFLFPIKLNMPKLKTNHNNIYIHTLHLPLTLFDLLFNPIKLNKKATINDNHNQTNYTFN